MDRFKTSSPLKFPLILLILLIIISGVFLTLSTGGFVLNFKQIGFTIVSTAQKGVFTITTAIGDTFTAINQLSTLREEYETLSANLENYQYLQRSNAEIRKENERLNELFGFTQQYSYKNYSAQIIGRNPDTLYSSITIDKGSRNGIKKNMPVIAIQKGNVGLVGKVITVGLHTSLIMPIYDFNCHVSARIQNTRDLGMITGGGSTESPLTLNYIRKRVLEELQYGDVIVTSGENDNYIKNISIGTISAISVVDYDTSLIISIIPTVDFSRLEEVIIIDSDTLNDVDNFQTSLLNERGE